jgi:hypothetical protein
MVCGTRVRRKNAAMKNNCPDKKHSYYNKGSSNFYERENNRHTARLIMNTMKGLKLSEIISL